MVKEVYEKMKTTEDAEERGKLKAEFLNLLSDVETPDQMKAVFAKDGLKMSDEEAERLYEQLVHVRKSRKTPMDMEEFILVSGGLPEYPRKGPDGWVDPGRVYRKNNQLYKRGYNYRIKPDDGCHSSASFPCWNDDECFYFYYCYDIIYTGDEREDIDPGRMSDDFINGTITGGEDF